MTLAVSILGSYEAEAGGFRIGLVSAEAVFCTKDRAQHRALVPIAGGQGVDQVVVRGALLLEAEMARWCLPSSSTARTAGPC